MVAFRSASVADTAAICDLWAAARLSGGRDIDRAEIAERLRNDDGFFVVGVTPEIDGLVAVGMGCYDDHRGWMKRVAIHPSQRGKGLGRQLVEEVENRFRAAGVTKIRLAVWNDNDEALSFWVGLDYEELPDIRYFTKEL